MPVPTLVKANIETQAIIARWPITAWIEGRREIWTMNGRDPMQIDCAYTVNGDYVGDLKFARFLAGKCIRPEKRDPKHHICSIGYSHPKRAWYGWSHRAYCAFMIGDKIFEPEYGDDNTLYTQHGSKTITNMEEARQAAIAFAEYVD
jgi:hypothetical protein